ncbi:MAG TPA: hypothetical protein PK916_03235 [Bacteroidota bacterium]|nr:hypothetical protein [Bacteroidota bacterium]
MNRRSLLLLIVLFLSGTACGGDRGDNAAQGDTPTAETRDKNTALLPPDDSVATPAAGRVAIKDSVLRNELLARLDRIERDRRAAQKADAVETMVVDLDALFEVLTVTARALDTQKDFRDQIDSEVKRFHGSVGSASSTPVRLMNAMSGVYAMYALLAKMRFVGRGAMQDQIQSIHDATVKVLKPDSKPVHTAAVIATSAYRLSRMIIQDIDSKGLYSKAFDSIEERYAQGNNVAKQDEDRYINGVFRTFEVSQLWALTINPAKRSTIKDISSGITSASEEAENVGEQMMVATEYLYKISHFIAGETVTLTL